MDNNTNDYLADFPALNQRVNDERLAYLDNAATVQRPRQVIQALINFYEQDNANVPFTGLLAYKLFSALLRELSYCGR